LIPGFNWQGKLGLDGALYGEKTVVKTKTTMAVCREIERKMSLILRFAAQWSH
jgi:hypothetical protein